jgi:hypothetical protein
VWHKKLEKQIMEGADVRELGLKAEKLRQRERLVRGTGACTRAHTRKHARPQTLNSRACAFHKR